MKYKHIGILFACHMATDINQGALAAMLPFFIAAYDLSYTAAAAIVFAVNMSSSVVQPLFGIAADRYSRPWLLPGGLMLAGLGLSLTGLVEGYKWILTLGIVSGIGIAAYHPVAARLVNFAAGNRKSSAMSIFGVGGTVGFTIGPIIVSTAMLHWGLGGTLVLIIPVTIMSLVTGHPVEICQVGILHREIQKVFTATLPILYHLPGNRKAFRRNTAIPRA